MPGFHLLAYRGPRRGEACGARWSELSASRQSLRIANTILTLGPDLVFDTPKSDSGFRELPLDADTCLVLQAHREHQKALRAKAGNTWRDHDLIFCTDTGEPLDPNHVSNRFQDWIAKLGLPPIRLHDLRHGAATLALAAGVPMKVVQEMLGHKTLAITSDLYTLMLPQLGIDAAESIAAAVPRTQSRTREHTQDRFRAR
ncbi:tyrosine-type recombinase/integrase [Allokutzneria oryzae]|uniref:Tyrosine-type recombinase/integrase n=1 Tax=Allokutzneria oryzae TaxID=1378989 RepID=A0ABV6A5P3_9PSEU